ncbi:sensor histidine kinase [Streptomyces sp. SHP 1-2]|uniref:sensor histidine kinase n=1 Tax=Streptomyces sp. SHP 1-2 TaxID=2769489 RepID=UPI0022371B5E|nr:sensor histidine kinase [Streptomyces sp. SHP 1-2]
MSLRTALLVLAFVPGIALVALWAVSSGQTFLDFQRQAAQGQLAQKAGQPSNIVYYNLQRERRLSAEVLAGRSGSATELAAQRKLTDKAVDTFLSASDISADDAPSEVLDAVSQARSAIGQLSAQRSLVDDGDQDQQEAVYRYYTDLISVDLKLFTALSHVDNGKVTTLSQPLVDLFWNREMISRSDALLARGWITGKLSQSDYQQVQQALMAQSFMQTAKILPYLPADEKSMWQEITGGPAWRAKSSVEQSLMIPRGADSAGMISLGAEEKTWRDAMDDLMPRLEQLGEHRTDLVVSNGISSIKSLLLKLVLTGVVGLLAVIAVIWTTWRLTRSLRIRIGRLHEQAEALEKALPEVVERLAAGERIDVEAEARAIEPEGGDRTKDELTQLGHALNLARTSALQAAVRQADQHRGFERLLQRIARRTQQLIGQQMKKLDTMERRHEDAEVLDGLFDLDHLTARLRRYEENLVILAGGTPHRRWRKPVPLLDVMRAAQGEVQEYQRVVLDFDGGPQLAARAVGPVSHVLAELIENALSFSRPPSQVEVRAAAVSRGLAIEVEDRGLGMEEDQLAEVNALMARPPRLDLLAHSEDIRLGLHVVARLASQYGLRIEFRTSAFGGTRVVMLVPHELTVAPQDDRPTGPTPVPAAVGAPTGPTPATAEPGPDGALPRRVQGRAMAQVTVLKPGGAEADEDTADPLYPQTADDLPGTSGATGATGTTGADGTAGGAGTSVQDGFGADFPDFPATSSDFAAVPSDFPDAPGFPETPGSGTDFARSGATRSGYAGNGFDASGTAGVPGDHAAGAAGDGFAAPGTAGAGLPGDGFPGDGLPGGGFPPSGFPATDGTGGGYPAPDGSGFPAPTGAWPEVRHPFGSAEQPPAPPVPAHGIPGYGTGPEPVQPYGTGPEPVQPYGTAGAPPAGGYGGGTHRATGDPGATPSPYPRTGRPFAGELPPAPRHGHDTGAPGPADPGTPEPPAQPVQYITGLRPYTDQPPPASVGTTPGGGGTGPGAPAGPGGTEPPLPRRVRQASLADELRVAPAPRPAAAKPPRWQDDPLLRPVPRRAGATIGAFQRRSRAVRGTGEPPSRAPERDDRDGPSVPPHPTREDRS